MDMRVLELYHLEDGLLRKLNYVSEKKLLFLLIDAPISSLHPGYSHVRHFISAFLHNTIYLNDDARHLNLSFSEVRNSLFKIDDKIIPMEEPIQSDLAFRSIMEWEIKILSESLFLASFRADEIEATFEFKGLKIAEGEKGSA